MNYLREQLVEASKPVAELASYHLSMAQVSISETRGGRRARAPPREGAWEKEGRRDEGRPSDTIVHGRLFRQRKECFPSAEKLLQAAPRARGEGLHKELVSVQGRGVRTGQRTPELGAVQERSMGRGGGQKGVEG